MSASIAQMDRPQLAAALVYAGRGWSVVPVYRSFRQPDGCLACECPRGLNCDSPGKHPAVGWTKHQNERADEKQIREWFEGRYASNGVGIITGAISGFFVVDVDAGTGKAGQETIEDLQLLYGDLPDTVEAKTGGGGRHILLKHPGSHMGTGRNVLGPGVDIRGDGGFVVTSPSLHASGRYYLWDEHHHPSKTAIADAPEWLIEQVQAAIKPGASDPTGRGAQGVTRDEWGKVIDGREAHMVHIICGVIASGIKQTGGLPPASWVFDEAWAPYERTTRARNGGTLEADNRGETLMRQRIGHMLHRASTGRWGVLDTIVADPSAILEIDPDSGEIMGGEPVASLPTPPEIPAPTPDLPYPTPAAPEPKSARITATSLADLDLDHIPPRRWIYGRELLRGFVSVLGSPGGTGKTAYALAAGFSVATDRPLLSVSGIKVPAHQAVHKTGHVWFYNLEDPQEEMLRRVKATMMHHRITKPQVADRVFVDSGRDNPLVIAIRDERNNLVAARPVVNALVAELKRRSICLFVVDPFVQTHSAEENRNEEMNLVMAEWARVAHMADCAVWLVHHFRKGGESGNAESFRGAVAIGGAARVMSTLSTMTPDEASKLGVVEEERRQYVRLDNAKSNMAPPCGVAEWYHLASVLIENGDEEYPEGDYVQAVEAWTPPSPWEDMPWSMIGDILDKVEEGPSEGEKYTLTKQGNRWAGQVVCDIAGKTEGQAASILKSWTETGLFEEGQYLSPGRKKLVKCISVNPAKVAEMRRQIRGGNSSDE